MVKYSVQLAQWNGDDAPILRSKVVTDRVDAWDAFTEFEKKIENGAEAPSGSVLRVVDLETGEAWAQPRRRY